MQASVSLLSASKVAGREVLTHLAEILEQRILESRLRGSAATAEMVEMMKVVDRKLVLILEILLSGGEILLCGGKVARLQVAAELVKGLCGGLGGRGGGSGCRLRIGLLQGGEVDCAAERLPDWRSWLSFCMSCWDG